MFMRSPDLLLESSQRLFNHSEMQTGSIELAEDDQRGRQGP